MPPRHHVGEQRERWAARIHATIVSGNPRAQRREVQRLKRAVGAHAVALVSDEQRAVDSVDIRLDAAEAALQSVYEGPSMFVVVVCMRPIERRLRAGLHRRKCGAHDRRESP